LAFVIQASAAQGFASSSSFYESLSPVDGGADLIQSYSWAGLEGASVDTTFDSGVGSGVSPSADVHHRLCMKGIGRSIIGLPSGSDRGETTGWLPGHAHHPDTSNPPIQFLGPLIKTNATFAITAGLATENSGSGSLVFYGRVPLIQDEVRREGEALSVGVEGGQFTLKVWDGHSGQPIVYQLQNAVQPPLTFTLINRKTALDIFVNGKNLGSVPNPGLFKSGLVYIGADVALNDRLCVDNFSIQEPSDSSGQTKVVLANPSARVTPVTGSLRAGAEVAGLNLGTAVSANALFSDEDYRVRLAQNFNMVTPENSMKFQFIHPSRDTYAFVEADAIVDFARANQIKVHGHALVWGEAVPRCVTEGGFSNAELRQILHDHVTTVVDHFKGRVDSWDVLNEPMEDDGALRQTIWATALGSDYPAIVFKWAHEADPNAKLYINEYGADGVQGEKGERNEKADGLANLVLRIRKEGAQVDGVGLQMHNEIDDYASKASIDENFKELQSLGIAVRISELDVKLHDRPDAFELREQADIHRDALQVCLSNRVSCGAFSVWGFEDKYSSLQNNEGMYERDEGLGNDLIFDRYGQPRPAYQALLDALAGALTDDLTGAP
jgi:endo-1,4-beta-xylanase